MLNAAVLTLVLTQPHPDNGVVYAWTQVLVLAGRFRAARSQFEAVREPEEISRRIPTLVLHDQEGWGDTVAYWVHYCPDDLRTVERCYQGGAEPVPLGAIDPAWVDEVDLQHPDTYVSLLSYAAATRPSLRMLLTLKGRSDFGLVLRDDDAGPGRGLLAEHLRTALARTASVRGAAVDVVVLASSSSSSVEYATALAGVSSVFVGTQESVSQGRLAYFRPATWLRLLRDYPAITPRELGRSICSVYQNPGYEAFDPQLPYAASAISVADLTTLQERLATLFGELTSGSEQSGQKVALLTEAARTVWHFGNTQARVDLGALLENLYQQEHSEEIADPALRSYIALRNAVIENVTSDPTQPTGVSIFLPLDAADQWSLRKKYRDRFRLFWQESGWGAVLQLRARTLRGQAPACSSLGQPGLPWSIPPLGYPCFLVVVWGLTRSWARRR